MTNVHTFALASELPGQIPASRLQIVQLTPIGAVSARDGRHFDFDDLEGIVGASAANAGTMELVVDFEHQTDLARENGKPAPAAGWIKKMEIRDTGIWGHVEWTELAAAMIARKEYRYLSPTIKIAEGGKVLRIARAALTNNPALEMTAIASQQNGEKSMNMKAICAALGLAETASEEDIVGAIVTLRKREDATATASAFEAIATGLAKDRFELNSQRQAAKVEEAIKNGVIPPALRDWGLELANSNEKSFETFCEKVGRPLAHLFSPTISDETMARAREQHERHTREVPPGVADEVARTLGIAKTSLL